MRLPIDAGGAVALLELAAQRGRRGVIRTGLGARPRGDHLIAAQESAHELTHSPGNTRTTTSQENAAGAGAGSVAEDSSIVPVVHLGPPHGTAFQASFVQSVTDPP